MKVKRYTTQNPRTHISQDVTYKVPSARVDEIRMNSFNGNVYMFGDMINKLGKYEDLGEPEELARKLGKQFEWLRK